MCVPLTSNTLWASAAGNVPLPARVTGLPRDSVANTPQIIALNRSRLTDRVRRLLPKPLTQLPHGIDVILGR